MGATVLPLQALSPRVPLSPSLSPSCLKHPAAQGVGCWESSALTAQEIYMPNTTMNSTQLLGITLLSILSLKPPLHLALSIF